MSVILFHMTSLTDRLNKRLGCRWVPASRSVSIESLSTAAQLYEKSYLKKACYSSGVLLQVPNESMTPIFLIFRPHLLWVLSPNCILPYSNSALRLRFLSALGLLCFIYPSRVRWPVFKRRGQTLDGRHSAIARMVECRLSRVCPWRSKTGHGIRRQEYVRVQRS